MKSSNKSNDLFELINNFLLGNYQGTINEANSLPTNLLKEDQRKLRDCYVFRSYIAQGSFDHPLQEIPKDSPDAGLASVRLLASYLTKELDFATVGGAIKKIFASNAINPIVQIVGATIYFNESNFEEAFRFVHQPASLECSALLIQIFFAH